MTLVTPGGTAIPTEEQKAAAEEMATYKGHILLYENSSIDLDHCAVIQWWEGGGLHFHCAGLKPTIIDLSVHPGIYKIKNKNAFYQFIHNQIIRFKLQNTGAFMDLHATIDTMIESAVQKKN